MELYFLSVGYGEAMVALDGEHCLLIGGGPGVDDAVYTQPGTIPAVTFLKEKQVERIDCMICTHVHNDHVSGLLEVARQFPVDTFWCNCLHADSPAAAVRTAQPVCDHDSEHAAVCRGSAPLGGSRCLPACTGNDYDRANSDRRF